MEGLLGLWNGNLGEKNETQRASWKFTPEPTQSLVDSMKLVISKQKRKEGFVFSQGYLRRLSRTATAMTATITTAAAMAM
jgi:hypothetical protein